MIEGKTVPCLSALFFALTTVIANAQHRPTYPHPPAPAQPQAPAHTATQTRKPNIDNLQLEREARELSDLAKSVPLDIEQVKQGLLPKDTVEKLKRIEKLAKHLRGELAP